MILQMLLRVVGLSLLVVVIGCSQPPAPPPPAHLKLPRLPAGVGRCDDNAPATFTTTPSGLKYRILRASEGAHPLSSQSVKVHYHGWLDNRLVFDSSYARGPTSFRLNAVVPGWTEGLQLVGVGGMIELVIPSKLGYGEVGSGPDIPPHATLHFIVELLEVKQ